MHATISCFTVATQCSLCGRETQHSLCVKVIIIQSNIFYLCMTIPMLLT